eukprot:Gb_33808 [translate_table: standard]
MAGGEEGEKAVPGTIGEQRLHPNTAGGEFLLDLLRGNIQTNNEAFLNTNDNKPKPKTMGASSFSAEEAWQLTDPAVAALGPSHPFHTREAIHDHALPPLQNPHAWLNSSPPNIDYPYHHHTRHSDVSPDHSLPCSLDPLLRPPLDPYDRLTPFTGFLDPCHNKPYDKPLLHSFGTPCAVDAASAHLYGSANGALGVPRAPETPWRAGLPRPGMGVEGGTWPYGHQPKSLFSGNETGSVGSSENHQPTFPGDIGHLQQNPPQFSGNGADFFEHLRGLSRIPENGFSAGSFVTLDSPGIVNENPKSVGGNPSTGNIAPYGNINFVEGNPSSCNLGANGKHNCFGGNGEGPIGLVPSQLRATVAQERHTTSEGCLDGYLKFGSIAWHSERDECNSEGNLINITQKCDNKKFELRPGDNALPDVKLPHKLQGERNVVRLLSRPPSNRQVPGNLTVPEEGVCLEDSKGRDKYLSIRAIDKPISNVARAAIKGTSDLSQGRKEIVHGKTTAFCMINSVHTDDRKQEADQKFSIETEKDSIQSASRGIRRGRSDLTRKAGIRNGAVLGVNTTERDVSELSKESTGINVNGANLETRSLKFRDGNFHKPREDLKKYRGNQQEWRMKQSQAEDQMQSGDLDSFSTIAGQFSALEVNECESCDFNDSFKKCSSSKNCWPDTSCSQPLASQLKNPRRPSGSMLHSVPASAIEQSRKELHYGAHPNGKHEFAIERRRQEKHRIDSTRGGYEEFGKKDGGFRGMTAHLKLVDDHDSGAKLDSKNNLNIPRLYKDLDSDTNQGMLAANQHRRQQFLRIRRKEIHYRADLEMFTPQFLLIYQSLIPGKEEEAKRKQLIICLETLITREWPGAQLHLYGSCANAFGVSNSDIDVCLSIDDKQSTKPELVLKLADILQAEDMQNVQALTHARVPIVKFTDPTTDISCDICINNILAVVNTKLLHDYAQIDVRLQQLAFMVKYWAKRRQINETYQGTLSSYAYVLMCIHFLQQRKPAILPCLQEMETTYKVTIDKIECAYYDQVDNLKYYGAENKETLGQLLFAFFDYWAFRHDYSNSVISVRTGGLLSKNEKDWTRRIGNERHLICIEDPFEISHDLGRVVDKHSIRVLKEEFQRAVEIMQHDPDPCVTLFKP